ncbi:Suppressor of cytokine signaling 6 [Saguinus oedipus]|uniref:Suppressor of cytokine signaling 6 n=1 Tax=Saguinus oedipus TaxID=9490 RepID=A0ABQ9TP74_SAGOE|nr:Suppressor of cytokine signaling 6 [Saguinus oedipus]
MLPSPWAGHDDVPPLSPLLPPMQNNQIQRNFSGLSGTEAHVAESMRCHLNFDPNSAPGVARVYDSESSGPMVVTSITEELKKLAKQGCYWGPITRWEAEGKLANMPDGSFLVPDSSDDRYLLSLSFRSHGKTLHTRIEHPNCRFSFYEQPDVEGHTSIVDQIEHSIRDLKMELFVIQGPAAWISNLAPQTDQPSVPVHAGALAAVPMSFCYTSVYQDRLNSETAFAKQNEGLFTGDAPLERLRTLHLALWE